MTRRATHADRQPPPLAHRTGLRPRASRRPRRRDPRVRLPSGRGDTAAPDAEPDPVVGLQRRDRRGGRRRGGHLYDLDETFLASLEPDLILTQSQCDVCAVNEGTVRRCAPGLPGSPRVESVNPTDWPGVAEMFARVGEVLGDREAGEASRGPSRRRRREIAPARRTARPRSASSCWNGSTRPSSPALDPGPDRHGRRRDVLGRSGEPSRRATWEEIVAADPEVILLSPCGFTLERSEVELPALSTRPEWRRLRAVREGRVVLIDGSGYFSRPGPRLLGSLRIAAAAIDPDARKLFSPAQGWRRSPISE